jgi:hypothetical protein
LIGALLELGGREELTAYIKNTQTGCEIRCVERIATLTALEEQLTD